MSNDPAGPGRRADPEPQLAPAEARALAQRLMEHEANGRAGAAELVPAGARVLQRLRDQLAPVLGGEGFRALEARALELARRGHAVLGKVPPGGSLTQAAGDVPAALAAGDPLAASEALQAVCAHLIGLLVTFLGKPLTTQFIRLAWPDLPDQGVAKDEGETR